jgi:hypothetical protein
LPWHCQELQGRRLSSLAWWFCVFILFRSNLYWHRHIGLSWVPT